MKTIPASHGSPWTFVFRHSNYLSPKLILLTETELSDVFSMVLIIDNEFGVQIEGGGYFLLADNLPRDGYHFGKTSHRSQTPLVESGLPVPHW